jgi:hypothetical protein
MGSEADGGQHVTLRVAATALDAWLVVGRAIRPRELRRIASRAWRSLPGDAIGWMVVRGCGIEVPTRVVDCDGSPVSVVEDPRIGRWFRLSLMPIIAQTLGRYVIAPAPLSDETLEHELEHVRQWRRLGPLYLPGYFGTSAIAMLRGRKPYWDNPFESAARDRARAIMAAREAAASAPQAAEHDPRA